LHGLSRCTLRGILHPTPLRPSAQYSEQDDIFEWHCTIRGPSGTEFEGGLYHFRILLPAEYPFRPPSLMMLTPNGRFELNTKICISFTNYHEEEWQPAWGVRTAILGLQGFFPLKGSAASGVGSVEYPVSERKRLAHMQVFILTPALESLTICHVDRGSGFVPGASKLTWNPFQTRHSTPPRP
jgi:ubiquitin-conjugating enzyme E2 J1